MSDTSGVPPPATSQGPPTVQPPPESTSEPSPSPPPPPPETTTQPPPPPPSSTAPPPPPPTTQPPPTTAPPPPSSQSPDPPPEETSSPAPPPPPEETAQTSTIIVTQTTTSRNPVHSTTSASTSTTSIGGGSGSGSGGGGGLSSSATIAIAVVVPIVAVTLLVVAGIFLWRRRKAKKDAEEERRKEVEDYAYHPNADPTLPSVGLTSDGPYEMRDDNTGGYRGWGSTAAGASTKPSTTLSGGGAAYSDVNSPIRGNVSDTRSGEPLMDGSHSGSYSPEGEILGAMGPAAGARRNGGGDVHRGPSNASSSYSAAGRSDGSGEAGVGPGYGGGNVYYEQYGSSNPYSGDMGYANQGPQELPAQPVIRDNPARRNTRIESPSHYPQQHSGISQNF